MISPSNPPQSDRRQFLKQAILGSAVGSAGLLARARNVCGEENGPRPFSFGLVTDIHYADADSKGTRHYRDSMGKLTRAIESFNKLGVSFAVELGDLVDAGPTKAEELGYLLAADALYATFRGPRHYVLGNHCLGAFTKSEFLAHSGARVKKSFYSFDHDRFHFAVLDANFKKDGTPYAAGNFTWTDTWIHPPQQRWLAEDLKKAAGKKTIVFVHQNLHNEDDPHGVKNAPQVRRILEEAENVLAVFQGHMHTGGYAQLEGIHYCTLRAMVEGPGVENVAHGVVVIDETDRVKLEGFGRQPDLALG
jgi:alkaline phosphatase